MIGRAEIQRLAREGGVDERTQERDYALTWMLAAMARQPSGFVFKGGTCLRRCYIPGYRYSEDLDFTATPEAASLDLVAAVGVWCAWLGQEAGIRAQAEGDASPRRAWVSFTGPLGALRQRSIKVDIPDDEAIVDRITDRQLISEYSDLDGSGFLVPCYSLAEIWAEKTRSLMQRSEPRDLYDLHELDRLDGGLAVAGRGLFREKARSKGLDPSVLGAKLDEREAGLRRRWDERLGHQVGEVPEFEETIRRVRRALRHADYL